MKKALRLLLYLYFLVLILFAVYLIYAWFVDYKPDNRSGVFYSESPDLISDTAQITMLLWNTSYFGKDHSTNSTILTHGDRKGDKERILKNSVGIKAVLDQYRDNDFILLQEVDLSAKRSGAMNQYQFISNLFPDRTNNYTFNYNVRYVPYPVQKPTGEVQSGLMTVGKYIPSISIRYAYPPDEDFPQHMFNYDRCFLVNRYKLSNEKELVVVNLQNTEMQHKKKKIIDNTYLFEFLKEEYYNGNYIIVGGDWNQTPAGYSPAFKYNRPDTKHNYNLDIGDLKNWKCLYDPKTPSVRIFDKAYQKEKTLTSVNDFILISPNITPVSIETIDTQFKYSMHQPVRVILKLKT